MSFTCESTGILADGVEEGAEAIDIEELARERRGKIEAEAVDVHLESPSSAANP